MAAEISRGPGWEPLPVPQDAVLDSAEVEDFLGEVTHDFVRGIDGDRRGITWAVTYLHGRAHTIAAGTPMARAADREQCSFADGPVLAAIGSGHFVHLADVGLDRRWPGYASAAAAHGVRSLLSTPIAVVQGSSAAINLYASAPHAFTSEDIIKTGAYAGQVAHALRAILRVAVQARPRAELATPQKSLVLAGSTLITESMRPKNGTYGRGKTA